MATVYTVGHSNRELRAFLSLLETHAVRALVDIRRHPGSRRHPHFVAERLAAALAERGIAYVHEPDLGGRRRPAPDSPNTFWQNAQFRGYADHMASSAFEAAAERVLAQAAETPTAVLCAEAVPWRCHRSLLADWLVAREHEVRHILSPGRTDRHVLQAAARVEEGRLRYPGLL